MGRKLAKLAPGFAVVASGPSLWTAVAGAAGTSPTPTSGATDWKQIDAEKSAPAR